LAVGDLDNDGWPDLVVSQANGPLTVLRNQAGEQRAAHWLGVQLVGRGNRPISGATLRLKIDGKQLTRFATSGSSYLSSCDPRVLFGLGQATRAQSITVDWPWGESERWNWEGRAIDQYWKLIEGEGEPQPALPK
jgi:hypothetical protein